MITVEKIGGTSMSRFEDVLHNIMLREPDHVYGRVYVVSAYAGVTNQLLEHKKTGAPGIYARFAAGSDYAAALDALLAHLIGINRELAATGLPLDVANSFIERRIATLRGYLDSMRHVMASGYVHRDSLLLARARCSRRSARRTARSTASRS
jgi:aspartate kinase